MLYCCMSLTRSLPRLCVPSISSWGEITQIHTNKADNLVCTHLKKLRKLIRNKSMELDEYDQGEDLVRESGRKKLLTSWCYWRWLLLAFEKEKLFRISKKKKKVFHRNQRKWKLNYWKHVEQTFDTVLIDDTTEFAACAVNGNVWWGF